MQGKEILGQFLHQHNQLRNRLREWAVTLAHAGGTYGQFQQAVSVLRSMCRFLETDVALHFRDEETVLYAALKSKFPQHRALVGELQHEHDVVRQALEDVRHELAHFDSTGELRQLVRLGEEMIAYLRYHLDREERTLHPLVLREFKDADWWELRRLYVDSEVA